LPTEILRIPASTDETEILSLIGSLHQAHHDKSAEGIAAPYSPHAVIYDLEPPLSHDGISVDRKRNWLATWDSPVDLEPLNFNLIIDGDHAIGHGFLRMSGKKKGVDRPVSFWMRQTVILEHTEAGWHIAHEHTSVPFYMDASLRPAFDLEP
jgi:ketosteroid isomerase-like protein